MQRIIVHFQPVLINIYSLMVSKCEPTPCFGIIELNFPLHSFFSGFLGGLFLFLRALCLWASLLLRGIQSVIRFASELPAGFGKYFFVQINFSGFQADSAFSKPLHALWIKEMLLLLHALR